MDIRSLKLELLERIALLDDEARLLALKRLLDAPREYGIPNENLNVVREGEGAYLTLEERTYTSDEVRALLDDIRQSIEFERADPLASFTQEELEAMDREREQAVRGEGTFYSIEEVLAQMKKDLGK